MSFWATLINSPSISVEAPFTYHHQNLIISGRIDCYYIHEDTVWILDYKTHHRPKTTPKNYERQLCIYHAALAHQHPNYRIRCALVYTLSGDFIEIEDPNVSFLTLFESNNSALTEPTSTDNASHSI